MVLHTRGRVGSRRFLKCEKPLHLKDVEAFSFYVATCSSTGPSIFNSRLALTFEDN